MSSEWTNNGTPPSTPPGSEYVAADGNTYTVGADGYIIIDSEGWSIHLPICCLSRLARQSSTPVTALYPAKL